MNKRYKKEWFDNEVFWQELHPYMFSQKRILETPEEIKKVLYLTRPEGNCALDLCCGPGRCSLALAAAGFKVTGVDKTKYLLDKARVKARNAKAKIEWVQSDMRDFVRSDTFDITISMYTSFGYFDNKQEDVVVLGNILASLKPGGACLIDVVGKERIAKMLQPTIGEDLPDGAKLIQRHEIFDDWTRIRNEWILIKKGKAKSFTFHMTIYSGQELRDRMEQVGFTEVQLFGNLDGDRYGPDAQRLIAIGRKPDELKDKSCQRRT